MFWIRVGVKVGTSVGGCSGILQLLLVPTSARTVRLTNIDRVNEAIKVDIEEAIYRHLAD